MPSTSKETIFNEVCRRLGALGLIYIVSNNNTHIRFDHKNEWVDVWPTTGKWKFGGEGVYEGLNSFFAKLEQRIGKQ